MDKDEQIRAHQQKWRRWNEEKKVQEGKKKEQIQQNLQQYTKKLIQKLGDPKKSTNNKAKQQASKKIGTQIETNVCGICLDLMVPPHNPMILFPCGHNFCKFCLFSDGHRKKQKYTLKLQNCPICRSKIQSYALNRNLMTLICTYTDNKHLLEQEMQEQPTEEQDNIEKLKIRCKILQQQKQTLNQSIKKLRKEGMIFEEVIQTLKSEKKRNERQIQKLQEEARLINRHFSEKMLQYQNYQKQLQELEDKERIIEKTLAPLLMQKQKMELLQIAKLIERN